MKWNVQAFDSAVSVVPWRSCLLLSIFFLFFMQYWTAGWWKGGSCQYFSVKTKHRIFLRPCKDAKLKGGKEKGWWLGWGLILLKGSVMLHCCTRTCVGRGWAWFMNPTWDWPSEFTYLSIHPFIHPSTHLCIHPSIHPSTHSSTHPLTYSSIHPSTHPLHKHSLSKVRSEGQGELLVHIAGGAASQVEGTTRTKAQRQESFWPIWETPRRPCG
jgi:hypothetical protein